MGMDILDFVILLLIIIPELVKVDVAIATSRRHAAVSCVAVARPRFRRIVLLSHLSFRIW